MNENQNPWPLTRFYFSVDWGAQTNIAFQEVVGLESETQIIEYRHTDSKFKFCKGKTQQCTNW
ncbi:MAG: phage tail protein [Flavobacteriales bacterium]